MVNVEYQWRAYSKYNWNEIRLLPGTINLEFSDNLGFSCSIWQQKAPLSILSFKCGILTSFSVDLCFFLRVPSGSQKVLQFIYCFVLRLTLSATSIGSGHIFECNLWKCFEFNLWKCFELHYNIHPLPILGADKFKLNKKQD